VHLQPGIASFARIPTSLAVTERIAGQILSLPMFASITEAQVDRVVEAVRTFYR
jgi:aminotransferase EvaB